MKLIIYSSSAVFEAEDSRFGVLGSWGHYSGGCTSKVSRLEPKAADLRGGFGGRFYF